VPTLFRTILTLSTALLAAAAAPRDVAAQVDAAERLRVFLDCRTHGCDRDFFIAELPYVLWTQDRLDADVHALITQLNTGAGGSEYTIAVLGQRLFVGRGDTVTTFTPPNSTDDARRREIARVLKLALVPYILRTPAAADLQLTSVGPPRAAPPLGAIDDPWNFWVYRISANGEGNAESRSTDYEIEGSLRASRITERTKVVLDLNYEYSANSFTLSDGSERSFVLREYDLGTLFVRSLSEHWSAAIGTSLGMTEFSNQDLSATVDVGVEYNLFPWREATSRQLVAIAAVGGQYLDYDEITIYGRMSETRPVATLIVAGESRQAWGSVDGSVRHRRYLHDAGVFSISGNARASFRITRGLSLSISAYGGKVNDQLFLPRGDATDDEVLTRQRALATAYRYGARLGISFTFGSIFNTIVNPRLDRAD
jgi:hypothetical protein